MENILLVTEAGNQLPTFRQRLAATFPAAVILDLADQTGLVVELSDLCRIFIEDYGTNLEQLGWEEEQAAFITNYLPGKQHIYNIHYRDIELAKKVIISLADSPRMIVDNDFGTLLIGADFVRKILTEPAWCWYDDL